MSDYSDYDSVLLKPLDRLTSEERVSLARDLLLSLSDDEWQKLLAEEATIQKRFG